MITLTGFRFFIPLFLFVWKEFLRNDSVDGSFKVMVLAFGSLYARRCSPFFSVHLLYCAGPLLLSIHGAMLERQLFLGIPFARFIILLLTF